MGDLQATIEIAVEFSSFHNVDLFQRGYYHIRCTLKPPEKTATNVDVEYQRRPDEQSEEECLFPALISPSGMTAISRTIQILYRNEEVPINDAFIFRLHLLVDSNKITQQVDSADVQLSLELFFSESDVGPESPESLMGVSSQTLKLHLSCIKGIHHHVPVLFDYFHFAVVDTTIHAVLTGLSLPDPSIIKPVKTSWFGVKSGPPLRQSTPPFYTKLFGTKPPSSIEDARSPADQRQIRFAYDTHRSLCSTLLSAQVNLLAYFQCLAEYLPASERLDIGKVVDFGERVDGLINGIEAATTPNEIFAQICGDLSSISSEICLVWSQFLESYTLNKRVISYFREEHHRQRIGHFSEAFFVQEYSWNELQIQQEQSFQFHQNLGQSIKSSRYYQSIPALVVESPLLDGDVTSTPIIFEEKFCHPSDDEHASSKEDLDEIDVTINCHDHLGNGEEAEAGAAAFLDDEELLIIENDFMEEESTNAETSFFNAGLVLREPGPLGNLTTGRRHVRETLILNDSSDDEFSDGDTYQRTADQLVTPSAVSVTFTDDLEPGTTNEPSNSKDKINGSENVDGTSVPKSDSGVSLQLGTADNLIGYPGICCEDEKLEEEKDAMSEATGANTKEEFESDILPNSETSTLAIETRKDLERDSGIDENPFRESDKLSDNGQEYELNREQESGDTKEIALDEIALSETTEGKGDFKMEKGRGSDSSEEMFLLANESIEGKSTEEVKEILGDIIKRVEKITLDHFTSLSSVNPSEADNASLLTTEESSVVKVTEDRSSAYFDCVTDTKASDEGLTDWDSITKLDEELTNSVTQQDGVTDCDDGTYKDGVSNRMVVTDKDQPSDGDHVTDNHDETDTTDKGQNCGTDQGGVANGITDDASNQRNRLPWKNNLLSYDEQRVHKPELYNHLTRKSTRNTVSFATGRKIKQSADAVAADSPSDSSVYETPLSSEAAVSSESQAESSSSGEGAGTAAKGKKSETDGHKGKKKLLQQKGLSAVSLGSCLPTNCTGNTSPSFKLSRGGSVYGGSVRSRFELSKRFVKRQLHYSCRIYSDLRLERIREPYFTGERPETLETHLIVCVHGLDGNSGDLRLFRCYLEMALPSTRLDFLMSEVNQADTFVTFEEMTEKLVQEIRHYIEAYSIFPSKLSFIGHSLGNIIIRSALTHPDMRLFAGKFHTLLSLSGPHLGMLYPTSPLVSTGLWLMQKWKKSDALQQLSLHDHTDLRQTFLYKLSKSSGLEYFKNILLVSSTQDHYVPYHSARMEMCRAAAKDSSEFGTIYREMVTNLMAPLKSKTGSTLVRYSVYHGLPSSANSFIGRAAHIAMLDSELFIEKMLLVSAMDYFR